MDPWKIQSGKKGRASNSAVVFEISTVVTLRGNNQGEAPLLSWKLAGTEGIVWAGLCDKERFGMIEI